ncbi:MAG: restriction endonuclease [Rhizobacter sp.]
MKFQMAKNSLFAILLRSPWWISLAVAAGFIVVSLALLPDPFRVAGALTSIPFLAISGVALRRQWDRPGAARIEQTRQAVSAMAWPAFSALLEQSFVRDGYTVVRKQADAYDFELERRGRRMLVSARRWKSARTGLEALRALHTARDDREVEDALYIGLGTLSDNAVPYAAEQRVSVWQAPELAYALRGLPLKAP